MNELDFLHYLKTLLETKEPLELDTEFRYIDVWSSLTGLVLITDLGVKYGKTITPAELKGCETIEDLYSLYQSK
jgi:acyl carrier protein